MHELPQFDVYAPSKLGEALSYLSGEGRGSRLLAGGTWLIPAMRKEGTRVERVVDLSGLSNLSYVRRSQNLLRIGALTTISGLADSDILDGRYCCFKRLGRLFGSAATRNMATVGGNLAAGAPGDLAEILAVLEGRVIIHNARRKRVASPTALRLAGDEMIVEVQFADLKGHTATWFNKFEKRKQGGAGLVTTTTLLRLRDRRTVGDVRIALSRIRGKETGRAEKAEAQLRGKAANPENIQRALVALESEMHPAGDYQGSSRFRKKIAVAMVREGLEKCLERLDQAPGRAREEGKC